MEQAIVIIGQIGYCMGGNFNIHIWAWSACPSIQVGETIEKSMDRCHIFTVRNQLPVFCPIQ